MYADTITISDMMEFLVVFLKIYKTTVTFLPIYFLKRPPEVTSSIYILGLLELLASFFCLFPPDDFRKAATSCAFD